MFGALPQVALANAVWPEDPEDASQAVVDECLQFIGDVNGGPPCFRSIQQYRFDIGVEDFEFGME